MAVLLELALTVDHQELVVQQLYLAQLQDLYLL
jgi:hypothetical protein